METNIFMVIKFHGFILKYILLRQHTNEQYLKCIFTDI